MAINKNNDNLDSAEDLKKKSGVDLKAKFLWQFWKASLESSDRLTFIEEVMKKWNISDSDLVKTKLEEFKAFSNDNDINNFNISDLTIFDLRKIVWKDFLKLNTLRSQLKKKIVWGYMISDNEYLSLFSNEIKNIDENSLNNFVNSESQLDIFVNSIFGSSVFKRKDLFPINFLHLSDTEKQDRLNKLNAIEQKMVAWIISDINSWRFIETDIRLLFATKFLKDSEKEILIKTFIPNLSLQKAIDLWILKKEKAQDLKIQIISNLSVEYDYTDSEIYDVLNKMPFDDFILDINDLSLNTWNISKLAENIGFKNAENDFIKSKEQFETELIENGPSSLDELIIWLKSVNKNSKFNNLEKFKEENIIQFVKKWADWEEVINYVKIVKADDNEKKLTFLTVWKWNIINLKVNWKENEIEYSSFLKNLSTTDVKIDLFTQKEINKKIKDPSDSEFTSSDLNLFTSDDIVNSTPEEKKKYLDYYAKKIAQDLDDLEEELKQKWGTDDENPLLVARIDEKKQDLLNAVWLTNNTDFVSFLNKQKFLEKIDQVDPDWKQIWFKKWVQFTSKTTIYIITWFEDEWVYLTSFAWKEWPIDFVSFYELFKENNAKRLESISDFNSLIDLNKFWNNKWEDHEIIDWELKVKDVSYNDETKNRTIDYLVSNENDKLVKINNISWDKVTIQFWIRKELSSLSDKDRKKYKSDKLELISIKDTERTITLTQLNNYINEHKLHPDWKVWNSVWDEKVKDVQNKFHWSLSSRIFNRTSINELLAWWTMFVEWFKESIKRWNDLHAAKFALALGSALPEEIRADLQIKVERQEAEEMDKALEWLGKVDSGQAIERIKWWLLNKDTPEFKKEAWLMFMVSKYWVLYAKWALGGKKGTFLWYEAFGWKVNDELYLKVKKDSEEWEPPIPFTEEKLMYEFLNKQCKEWGYNWIKRRWRLYKEYDGKISQWITDELAKWSREAQAMRSFKDRNGAAMWEFKWGEFNNGLWKYKEAVNRWAPLHDLNELPFTLLFSWTCYLLQEEQLNEFKAFSEWWMKFWGLLFTKFLSDTDWMKVFNKTILALSEDFEKKDPSNFKWMYEKAEKVFNNQKNSSLSVRDKMNAAEKFWWNYWEALTRTMLKLNNRDSTYVKTDKLLLSDSDKYKTYNTTLDSYIAPAVFSDEWIMNDQFAGQWVSWLSYKVFDEIGWLWADAKFRNNEAAENILAEIIWEIKNTREYSYSNNDKEDRKIKILNLQRQLSFLFSYIKRNEWQTNTVRAMKEWSSYWWEFKKLGISKYIDTLKWEKFSINNLSNLDDNDINNFINSVAIEILDWDSKSNNWFDSEFTEIMSNTKNQTDNLTS